MHRKVLKFYFLFLFFFIFSKNVIFGDNLFLYINFDNSYFKSDIDFYFNLYFDNNKRFLMFNYFDEFNSIININNFYFDFYNLFVYKPYYLNMSLKKNYICSDNIPIYNLSLLDFSKNKTDESETWIRRAEILFFISIPFSYIYISTLIKFQNLLLYGNFDKDFNEFQKRFLYIGVIFIGIVVVIEDLIG